MLLGVAIFSILSLVAYSFPVLKRALAIFGNSNPVVALKLAQQWTGMTVVLCSVGPALSGAAGAAPCILSFTMAVITSVEARVSASRSGSATLPQ